MIALLMRVPELGAELQYAHLPARTANELCNAGTLLIVMIEDQAGLDCVE